MEHRQYSRINTFLVIKLIVNGEIVAVTRAAEISRGGVRIINPGLAMKNNQILDVCFKRRKEPKEVRVKSMVVHSSDTQIGLMFGHELPVEKIELVYRRENDVDEKIIPGYRHIKSGCENFCHH